MQAKNQIQSIKPQLTSDKQGQRSVPVHSQLSAIANALLSNSSPSLKPLSSSNSTSQTSRELSGYQRQQSSRVSEPVPTEKRAVGKLQEEKDTTLQSPALFIDDLARVLMERNEMEDKLAQLKSDAKTFRAK